MQVTRSSHRQASHLRTGCITCGLKEEQKCTGHTMVTPRHDLYQLFEIKTKLCDLAIIYKTKRKKIDHAHIIAPKPPSVSDKPRSYSRVPTHVQNGHGNRAEKNALDLTTID